MDYQGFLRLRTPVWERFEESLRAARRDPRRLTYEDLEAMALAYRQVMHDHALMASRFPGTGAARRLRRLALQGTHVLRRDTLDHLPGLGEFLTRRFPLAFRAHAVLLAAAFALFATALVFGAVLAIVQPRAGAALLGPRAIAGLRDGHLWTESLVSTVPPAVSSSGIATNNMSVAIAGWAGGALLGLGSLYVILFNGALLGAVVATTLHYGLAGALLAFVSAHGPLEITLILTAAAGGLGLGRALVAAEDVPRRAAVTEASREALVLLLGCLPWFVLLGIVEGFISPSPTVPVAAKVALGLALEAAFLLLAWNPRLS
jgi:uncharacterized membrane protein SpoIIM required for sporulation